MTRSMSGVDRRRSLLESGLITEEPVFYQANGETLFALHTIPSGTPRDEGVVLVGGGWFGTSAGRNRTFVRVARELSGQGFHVVRLDWHGMGESTGEIDRYHLDEPFVADLIGAVDILRAAGVRRVVAVGVCFGARTALCAVSALPELAGLVLTSVPVERREPSPGAFRVSFMANQLTVREYIRRGARLRVLRGLTDPGLRRGYRKAWLARRRARRVGGEASPTPQPEPSVLAGLAYAAHRSIPVLFLYGEDDAEYGGFQLLRSAIAPELGHENRRVQFRSFPGTLPGFPRLDTQRRYIESIVTWMDEQFPERSVDQWISS